MQLAPWLGTVDPIAAARAGASLGLEKRGQDIQQREAASRLLASEADSAQQGQQFQQQLALRQQQVQAADALRQQQQDMLNRYRNAEIQKMNQQADAMKAAADLKSQINDQTQSLYNDVYSGDSSAVDALHKYPLAGNSPEVRQLVNQELIQTRQEKAAGDKQSAQDQLTSDESGFWKAYATGTSASDALNQFPKAAQDAEVKRVIAQGGKPAVSKIDPIDKYELDRLQSEMNFDRSAESAAIAGEGKGDPKEWRKQYEAHKSEYDDLLKKYRKPEKPVASGGAHDEEQDVDPAGIGDYLK